MSHKDTKHTKKNLSDICAFVGKERLAQEVYYFFADFVVFDKIILEVKSQKGIVDEHYSWVINYLGISKCPLGLIVNFGENSLVTKRVIL